MNRPLRNSVFGTGNGRGRSLGELLENPAFATMVRLFLVVIVALGGYIWQAEMERVNEALAEIKASVQENNRRQWAEIRAIQQEVSRVNGQVTDILHRTNLMLVDVLERVTGEAPHGPPAREEGVAPSSPAD